MASGPITSWQIDGGKMERVADFLFLGSKITVDGDCSHEIKGRKVVTDLDKVVKGGDITLWQIDGKIVADFIFWCSKITADGDYSHEIKRGLLLGRKVIANLDSILKSRDITLSTKVHPVKAMVFPAVRYGCESWTLKKAEC